MLLSFMHAHDMLQHETAFIDNLVTQLALRQMLRH